VKSNGAGVVVEDSVVEVSEVDVLVVVESADV
jgi:hypothetical protein